MLRASQSSAALLRTRCLPTRSRQPDPLRPPRSMLPMTARSADPTQRDHAKVGGSIVARRACAPRLHAIAARHRCTPPAHATCTRHLRTRRLHADRKKKKPRHLASLLATRAARAHGLYTPPAHTARTRGCYTPLLHAAFASRFCEPFLRAVFASRFREPLLRAAFASRFRAPLSHSACYSRSAQSLLVGVGSTLSACLGPAIRPRCLIANLRCERWRALAQRWNFVRAVAARPLAHPRSRPWAHPRLRPWVHPRLQPAVAAAIPP